MMSDPLYLIGLLVGLVLLALLLWRKKSGARPQMARPPLPPAAARPVAPPQVVPPAAQTAPRPSAQPVEAPPPLPVPAALQDLPWPRAEALPEARREALLADLRKTPPPPRSFHQLVSPDFVAKASSAELSELVISEPLVAAKVLARVNSAAYGLQRPVGSVGQAVTFLGLNTVRGICLQYMLEASFKADTPALKQRFDQLWAASAVAGELCARLAQRLHLPEPGALVTQVVLSFLGHFAAALLMPRAAVPAARGSLLERCRDEQAQLGLPAAEIGALLMQAWALPEGLVEEVRGIDRQLLGPPSAERHALGYLCARLGERLAQGESVDLANFEPCLRDTPDFFHLYASLPPARRAQWLEALQAPELVRGVQALLATLRSSAG